MFLPGRQKNLHVAGRQARDEEIIPDFGRDGALDQLERSRSEGVRKGNRATCGTEVC